MGVSVSNPPIITKDMRTTSVFGINLLSFIICMAESLRSFFCLLCPGGSRYGTKVNFFGLFRWHEAKEGLF